MGIALNREQEIMLICGGAKESGLKIWDKVRMIEGLPLGNLSITQFFCRNSEFEFKAEVLIEVARQKDPPPVPVGVAKVLATTPALIDERNAQAATAGTTGTAVSTPWGG